jgi:hypothetical protein
MKRFSGSSARADDFQRDWKIPPAQKMDLDGFILFYINMMVHDGT